MSFALPVIVNAGPLMALGKLNCLDLLAALYDIVEMPNAVYQEVVVQGVQQGEVDARVVDDFWQRQQWPIPSVDKRLLANLPLHAQLGQGEREVIVLATTKQKPLVLLDDSLARAEARRLGIRAQGTLGTIVQSYRNNIISQQQADILVKEIMRRPDIWISTRLCKQILEWLDQN